MKTKKKTFYCCEYCGIEFNDKFDCGNHEKQCKKLETEPKFSVGERFTTIPFRYFGSSFFEIKEIEKEGHCYRYVCQKFDFETGEVLSEKDKAFFYEHELDNITRDKEFKKIDKAFKDIRDIARSILPNNKFSDEDICDFLMCSK